MTLEEFKRRCETDAVELDDRLCRWISSPQEHELMVTTETWPFWHLLLHLFLERPTNGIRLVDGRWEDVAGRL